MLIARPNFWCNEKHQKLQVFRKLTRIKLAFKTFESMFFNKNLINAYSYVIG